MSSPCPPSWRRGGAPPPPAGGARGARAAARGGFLAALADSRVGLVIDAFHFYAGGSTLEMLDGLDPARLFIVHLDDAEDRPRAELPDAHPPLPGRGVMPLVPLV